MAVLSLVLGSTEGWIPRYTPGGSFFYHQHPRLPLATAHQVAPPRMELRMSSSSTFSRSMTDVYTRLKALTSGGRAPGEIRLAHDDITYRRKNERGEMLGIPHAERYSTNDWIHNIINIPGSQVLARIKYVILTNMAWAAVVVLLYKKFAFAALPAQPHSLLGSALGLLLVFRTNASYSRYWEGRKLWEKILNKSRDLSRMAVMYEDAIGTDTVINLTRLLMAYPVALHEHLTGVSRAEDLERTLGPGLADQLRSYWNKPLAICTRLGMLLRNIPDTKKYDSRERLAMMSSVNELSSYLGACERIVQTPVPLSYARHTSRFLTLWLLSLPAVLVGITGWYSVTIIGFMAWALFGILEIGLQIEDPFPKQLRLEVLTRAIIESVQETVQTRPPLPQRHTDVAAA